MKTLRGIVAAGVLLAFSGCRKPTSNRDSTESLQKLSPYPIGVAVNYPLLFSDSTYMGLVKREFSSVTAENIFKFEFLHPEPQNYDWFEADVLANFCGKNSKRLHGHCLVWENQLPPWVSKFQGTKAQWDSLMKSHITTVVSHFAGRVSSWDVVNEAFEEDGSLKKNIWLEHIGPTYIERAFEYAAQVDSKALLFYNDYELETNPDKLKAVIQFMDNLRQSGIRIDGIGLQTHVNILYTSSDLVAAALKQIADHGYQAHLSEIDVSVNPWGTKKAIDPADFELQADKLAEIIHAFSTIETRYRYGITFWGLNDKSSWLRSKRLEYPLLFDDNYKPKPVYYKLKEIL